MIFALPTVPANIRAHYAAKMPALADDFDRIFAWIETFDDGCMTEGNHVIPLVALANKGERNAILTCVILWNHNQEPWLWERMGFHALAGIQGRCPFAVQEFALGIRP